MTLPTKLFSSFSGTIVPQDNLLAIQKDSYKWFVDKGLKELFKEISPIKDYSGKDLELYFSDYYFNEPKYTEVESINKGITYEAPLRVTVKLINKADKKTKEQEV